MRKSEIKLDGVEWLFFAEMQSHGLNVTYANIWKVHVVTSLFCQNLTKVWNVTWYT